jgi:hypothetical protein
MTVTLYREGRRVFGPERWQAFLASFNDLRVTDRVDEKASVDSFFRIVGGLRTFGTFDRVDDDAGPGPLDPGHRPSRGLLVPGPDTGLHRPSLEQHGRSHRISSAIAVTPN